MIGSCEKGLALTRSVGIVRREGGREKERESERGKKRRNVTKVAISFADTIPVLGNGELL